MVSTLWRFNTFHLQVLDTCDDSAHRIRSHPSCYRSYSLRSRTRRSAARHHSLLIGCAANNYAQECTRCCSTLQVPSNLACSSYTSMLAMQNGTPVSMQQLKKIQLPTATQQMRISSRGGMRPPMVSVSNLQPALQQSQPVQLQIGALPAWTPTSSRSTPIPVP
jgi:hypothetical protein